MIDILKDIVKHTHGLGFLDLVKITGTSDATAIDSMAEDRSVILQGSFHKPQSGMIGTTKDGSPFLFEGQLQKNRAIDRGHGGNQFLCGQVRLKSVWRRLRCFKPYGFERPGLADSILESEAVLLTASVSRTLTSMISISNS